MLDKSKSGSQQDFIARNLRRQEPLVSIGTIAYLNHLPPTIQRKLPAPRKQYAIQSKATEFLVMASCIASFPSFYSTEFGTANRNRCLFLCTKQL
eukprot:scaffold1184_cov132-Cylindrotheca_fusiformis.AAC.65